MMRITLSGGKVICPETQKNSVMDCHLDEGKFLAFGSPPTDFRADRVIDASNLWVLPGLVDLSVSQIPSQAERAAAFASGITTLCCTPQGLPVLDSPALIQNILEDQSSGSHQATLLPMGALTMGLEGTQLADLCALKQAGCIAISNGLNPIVDLQILRQCYQYAATFDLLVVVYPQDAWIGTKGVIHEGVVSAHLGLPGIPPSAETIPIAQHILLMEETGVRLHIAGISTAHGVDIFSQAVAKKQPITASVSMAHLWLCEMDCSDFNPNMHVYPPFRSDADRFALIEAVKSGLIKAIHSDHCALKSTDKLAPFAETKRGMSGIDTLLPLAHHLAETGKIPFEITLKALTSGPASIIQQALGALQVGQKADFCLYDPNARWTVTPQTLYSQGHNMPFIGWELPGRVVKIPELSQEHQLRSN